MANRKTVITFTVFGILMLLYQWFYFDLYHLLTPGGMVYFSIGVILLSLVMLAWAVLHWFLMRKKIKRQSLTPLLVYLVTYLIVFFFPFYPTRAALNYGFHYDAREKVVEMISDGTLTEEESHELVLPEGYQGLSREGKVTVIRSESSTLVRFYFVKSEAPDPLMSFIYTSDGHEPTPEELGETVSGITKQAENWFYVVSYQSAPEEAELPN